MYKPELAYRSEAQPSEERVMKGYTCGRLEKKRHRVHFSVLLVTDPQERSKVYCQRNSSYTNRLKSITRKYTFVTIIIYFLGGDYGRVVVVHHHITMSYGVPSQSGNESKQRRA